MPVLRMPRTFPVQKGTHAHAPIPLDEMSAAAFDRPGLATTGRLPDIVAREAGTATRGPARVVTTALARASLATQFLVASLVVLLLGMVVTGSWVSRAIEHGVLNRSAALTALYVDSVLSPHLQALGGQPQLDAEEVATLDSLLAETPLGQRVVAFKVWSPGAQVLYSPDRRLMGQEFGVDEGLARALQGEVSAELSDLDEPENAYEREQWSQLLEVYAPVRADDPSGRIVGAVEFYQSPDELEGEVAAARAGSWAVVGVVTLVMYVLLGGIVRRGSNTILRQQRSLRRQEATLREQVVELSDLLNQNARLHDRVRRAAERTTALNEQALRRIGGDLHDGPGQTLGLALLRLDLLDGARPDPETVSVVRSAVQDALGEIRAISTGLRLPELAPLDVAQVASRAMAAHVRRSGTAVDLQFERLPRQAPLPVKITLFRTLEEALSNATRHGLGRGVVARLEGVPGGLRLTVSDRGPGFCPNADRPEGHLGLANMRERAEVLGGTFEVRSAPGQGTTVVLWLPLPA
jgi:signal transduction histidine kinase